MNSYRDFPMRNILFCALALACLRAKIFANDFENASQSTPNAEAMLAKMQHQMFDNYAVTGRLREGSKRVGFSAQFQERKLTVEFTEIGRKFLADLERNELFEIQSNQPRKLSESELNEEIGGTGLGIHDLSLQFLFWTRHEDAPGMKIRGKDCVAIVLFPPSGDCPYSKYTVWMEANTGCFSRAVGQLKDGVVGRQIDIMSTQKVNDKWYLKSVRFVAKSFKRISYIDFDPPSSNLQDKK